MVQKTAKILGVIVVLYIVVATVLVFWPSTEHSPGALARKQALEAGTLSPADAQAPFAAMGGADYTQVYPFEEAIYDARDGTKLFARHFLGTTQTTIVIVHGLDATSAPFNRTAGLLREATGANVIAVDMRGHGQSGGRPWDVDYTGQYEDDVADVISQIRAQTPDGKIILAGHSMGGGIALRYAALKDEPEVNGYLLFAPSLGNNAPTMRTEMPKADPEAEPFAGFLPLRFIGIKMFNLVRINAFDHLPVIFINMSPDPSAYSYRAMMSTAPKDYVVALEAVDKPLLVLVGSNDQPFLAEEFEPVINAHSDGETILIEGQDHVSIHSFEGSIAAVRQWLALLDATLVAADGTK